MTPHRRHIYYNPDALSWTSKGLTSVDAVEAFHSQVEGNRPSPLVPLPGVAKGLGVKSVYAKDETSRLGSSVVSNNLGLSWAVFRALTERLGLSENSTVESVKARLVTSPVTLFAASDGNHGRALAQVGSLFSVPVQVYVPAYTTADTIALIRAEGAKVKVSSGISHREALSQAEGAAYEQDGIHVQDEAGHGDSHIPQVGHMPFI